MTQDFSFDPIPTPARRARRSKTPFIVSAVILVIALAGVGGWLTWRAVAGSEVRERAEFEKLVVGKTGDEVIAKVGRPDEAKEIFAGTSLWFYFKRTINPITRKADNWACVTFWNKRAITVTFD